MSATTTPISIQRGDTQGFTLTVTWGVGTPDQDLHDYAVEFTAKNSPLDPDADAVISLSVGNGVTITSATVADVQIPAAITATLPCLPPTFTTQLFYDVQLVGPDLKPHTVVIGTLTVFVDVTQSLT